jgi:hypothetical protein
MKRSETWDSSTMSSKSLMALRLSLIPLMRAIWRCGSWRISASCSGITTLQKFRVLVDVADDFKYVVSVVWTAAGQVPIRMWPRNLDIAEIEQELDIIRGVVPTPTGYSTTPDQVKDLMAELKSLRSSNRPNRHLHLFG